MSPKLTGEGRVFPTGQQHMQMLTHRKTLLLWTLKGAQGDRRRGWQECLQGQLTGGHTDPAKKSGCYHTRWWKALGSLIHQGLDPGNDSPH